MDRILKLENKQSNLKEQKNRKDAFHVILIKSWTVLYISCWDFLLVLFWSFFFCKLKKPL